MEINAGMVKALREKTGLPMMECKKALEEAKGDDTLAVELLRKKGMAQLTKRAGRETSEGRVVVSADAATGRVAMVEVLCETEPVAGTADFIRLTQIAGQAAAKIESPTAEAVLAQPIPDQPSRKIGDFVHDVVNRIRENIRIGRVTALTGNVGQYLHHDNKKGVLVQFSGPCPEELKLDVCMHVVAMRPMCTRREEIDPELVARERRIAAEQVTGKPANLIDKIVTGKLNRWYSETVLLEQLFVKADKKSVGQVLKAVSPDLTVTQFQRFEIGEA
jgi:elongation factor Ts